VSPVAKWFTGVGDCDIAYSRSGSGRPLVCVHGNFASKSWFAELLERPPAGWQVLAPDLPNFGGSSPLPGDLSIEGYARALQGFLDALGLESPVLLGHSLGGAVVQALAAERPGLPAALVLVASAPPDGFPANEEHLKLLAYLKGNRDLIRRALEPTMPSRRPPYFDALVGDALQMTEAAFTGNSRALERHDVSAKLALVTCPVLVVWGENDVIVTRDMARRTAQAFPNARLEEFSGVGHSPQIEVPQRFERLLAEFLASVKGGNQGPTTE
jgi:pimeloyl-ACP methyl ester carboxylesterase